MRVLPVDPALVAAVPVDDPGGEDERFPVLLFLLVWADEASGVAAVAHHPVHVLPGDLAQVPRRRRCGGPLPHVLGVDLPLEALADDVVA